RCARGNIDSKPCAFRSAARTRADCACLPRKGRLVTAAVRRCSTRRSHPVCLEDAECADGWGPSECRQSLPGWRASGTNEIREKPDRTFTCVDGHSPPDVRDARGDRFIARGGDRRLFPMAWPSTARRRAGCRSAFYVVAPGGACSADGGDLACRGRDC